MSTTNTDELTQTETEEGAKNYKKTQLTLPDEVSATFRALELQDKLPITQRNQYIRALRDAEWTLQAISEATGLTRERVRQIVRDTESSTDHGFEIPEPPQHEVKAPREYVEPDPEKLQRMLELQKAAQSVRSNSPKNREEAEEYTRLVAESHLQDGVPLYRLSKRLSEQPDTYGKASHGALRFRLARYGYKKPKTGTSHVYATIKPENRVHG